ncbi:hypothetical protein CMI39_01815 [Candidatus Pacearchaeota archaeon]|jgi:MtN3 and saliva related transmembrane protein|nr:hypothetical protein [Candidatus Pacearchaeota archaeon]|tara:strand:- start:9322 stop:9576 length:255 start_codon:yes stop_codon:yes gene_type:complete
MDWIIYIGLIAAGLTTGSLLPQAIKTINTKSTKDISLLMYLSLIIGVILWLVYGILIKDLPLIIANGISLIFVTIILTMKIKYK